MSECTRDPEHAGWLDCPEHGAAMRDKLSQSMDTSGWRKVPNPLGALPHLPDLYEELKAKDAEIAATERKEGE